MSLARKLTESLRGTKLPTNESRRSRHLALRESFNDEIWKTFDQDVKLADLEKLVKSKGVKSVQSDQDAMEKNDFEGYSTSSLPYDLKNAKEYELKGKGDVTILVRIGKSHLAVAAVEPMSGPLFEIFTTNVSESRRSQTNEDYEDDMIGTLVNVKKGSSGYEVSYGKVKAVIPTSNFKSAADLEDFLAQEVYTVEDLLGVLCNVAYEGGEVTVGGKQLTCDDKQGQSKDYRPNTKVALDGKSNTLSSLIKLV